MQQCSEDMSVREIHIGSGSNDLHLGDACFKSQLGHPLILTGVW